MFNTEYSRYYDLFNSDKPYQQEVEFVYQWMGRPTSILDVGCGTASYWQYYPKKTRLVGLDRSSTMAHGDPRIIQGDINNFKTRQRFKCATALFDVVNYVRHQDWWQNLPIQKGGYYVFDVWDTEKIFHEGFKETRKTIGEVTRIITPVHCGEKQVILKIRIQSKIEQFEEYHTMYLHTKEDLLEYCGTDFRVVEIKPTERWQTWWKLRRK